MFISDSRNEPDGLRIWKWRGLELHPFVFPLAGGTILFFVVVTALWPRRAEMAFNWLQAGITHRLGWLYIFSMSGFLALAL